MRGRYDTAVTKAHRSTASDWIYGYGLAERILPLNPAFVNARLNRVRLPEHGRSWLAGGPLKPSFGLSGAFSRRWPANSEAQAVLLWGCSPPHRRLSTPLNPRFPAKSLTCKQMELCGSCHNHPLASDTIEFGSRKKRRTLAEQLLCYLNFDF